MLALAAYPLGIRIEVFDPTSDACAAQVAVHHCAAYEHEAALARFAEGKACITCEFENVSVEAMRFLANQVAVRPAPRVWEIFQDRLLEKQYLRSVGIPTVPFAPVDPQRPTEALEQVGCPCVVKTRRFGYDGKGQRVARTREDYLTAVAQLAPHALLVEAYVPFERELSILGVRSLSGEMAVYPLVENHHREGILRLLLAPARDDTGALQSIATGYITRLLESLDYVGVMALELFQVGEQLLANEVAPRVHNSGHWSIEGAETSQFENHLRAILGYPLGCTAPRGVSAMINLIGELPPVERVLSVPGAHLHLYGKSPRPGRKLGHITLRADSVAERERRLQQLCREIGLMCHN
jgi:5-(carboxyamino)imidazole ribonucleotide synthase